MAEAILPVTRQAGVGLVINDHVSIAREIGADVCHLGQEDFFDAGHAHVSELRSVHPPQRDGGEAECSPSAGLLRSTGGLRIGLSTHSPQQAKRALDAGADYIAVGPVYPTGTKPTAVPVTLDYVQWAAEHVKHVPWFAIGGITLDNLDDVLAAGARRICVVSAILKADNVTDTCRVFRERILPGKPSRIEP